ncbi:MAG: phosphatase PAP2 family protein [Ignavibacteria bacterium]|nr:phosphatase PAP2 family protein [Ignavibacteria bacterium]
MNSNRVISVGIIVRLVLLLTINSYVYPQQDSSKASLGETLSSDASVMLHDAGEIFGAPLHFSEREWITTGGIAAGTLVLFLVDESARSLSQRNQSSIGDDLAEVGRQYGREVYGISLGGGLYAGGLIFKNKSVRETGYMLFESIVFAGVTTTVLKSVIGRSRPSEEEGSTRIRGFQTRLETTSLPSGHATVAFAVSSLLGERIGNPYATVGLYSLATLTALSRVYNDAHWFSDTFLGAAVGMASGIAVGRLHDDAAHHSSLRVVPFFGGMRVEITF